ncbi:MAG: peptidase U32 family protein, partial [Methylocystaceae bacterium]
SRIVAARELSLEQMANIRQQTQVEIEAFVHGAMCISYSGRCLLSSFMTGRSGNRGECAHPCRYNYRVMTNSTPESDPLVLVEELRPGEYFPIEEDQHGTYIMNSKDLCLWDEIPAMMAAGIDAFKIEGRMKSLHYVATVTRAYREAIDAAAQGVEPDREFWRQELTKVATRPYTKGFLYGVPADAARDENKETVPITASYCGLVTGYEQAYGRMLVEERAPFKLGDELEIFTPQGQIFSFTLDQLWGADRIPLERAKHARELLWIPYPDPIPINSLLRKKM